MPEEFSSVIIKKPWHKTAKGIVFLIAGGLLLLTVLIFMGFFIYYVLTIKYGDANKLTEEFGVKKFSVDASRQINNTGITASNMARYIRPFNPVYGNKEALITVVVFADFECQFCQEAYPGFKQIMEKYQPVMKAVFKHLPLENLHPNAIVAANAAACAGEGSQFWPYHDLLFTSKKLDGDSLKSYARKLGIAENIFTECLQSKLHQEEIDKDLMDATALGVRGTPTYFINGIKLEGVIAGADWDRVVLEILNK